MDTLKLWLKIFAVFFKTGMVTFGGGMTMAPVMQREVVEKRKWLTEGELLDCFALSQSLPGIVAVNAGVYTGYKVKGVMGAIFATLGITLPAFLAIVGVILFLEKYIDNVYVRGALEGVKTASAALIVVTAWKMGKKALRGKLDFTLMVIAFGAICVLDINALWVIFSFVALGVMSYINMKVKNG